MTTYNPVSPEFLAEVEAVIGKENVFTDPEKLDMYKTDEEYDPRRFRVPEAVVRPGTPEEIAAIVKLCNKYMVPITVRSGGTSLADGAIAVCGGKNGVITGAFPPCGVCRQVMREFCRDDFLIYLVNEKGFETVTLSDLLPFGFRAGEHMSANG